MRDATTAARGQPRRHRALEVQAERRVSRGGAIVRTGEGEVDATLETQARRAPARSRGRARPRASSVAAESLTLDGARGRAPRALARVIGARRPAPPPRPRLATSSASSSRPPASRRGRRGLRDRRRPRPRQPVPAEVVGFRARPHAAHAARRDGTASARATPSRATGRQLASRSATTCSAACSTGSASRSTAAAPRRDDAAALGQRRRRPTRSTRPRIDDRISLGVRALDALVPCGRGQRLGIFAGSGVGKSSLLGMIARSHVGRRQRHLPRRRARPRGPRVHRARPRRRASSARSWSSRPPTSPRSCASRPR